VFAGDPGGDVTALSRVCYTISAGKVIFDGHPRPGCAVH
jgi:hypothetical protein